MTEAAYPIRKSLVDTKLSIAGDIEIIPTDVPDYRPTQEFKNCVQDVIELRSKGNSRGVLVPLSEHLDNELKRRRITR